jgi:hypothetical protein
MHVCHSQVVDTTALMCRSCSWFGVYGSDVTGRIKGCPVCGVAVLSAREIDEDEWHEVGRQLLEARDDQPGKSAGR